MYGVSLETEEAQEAPDDDVFSAEDAQEAATTTSQDTFPIRGFHETCHLTCFLTGFPPPVLSNGCQSVPESHLGPMSRRLCSLSLGSCSMICFAQLGILA